jgi:hypothetical protein
MRIPGAMKTPERPPDAFFIAAKALQGMIHRAASESF